MQTTLFPQAVATAASIEAHHTAWCEKPVPTRKRLNRLHPRGADNLSAEDLAFCRAEMWKQRDAMFRREIAQCNAAGWKLDDVLALDAETITELGGGSKLDNWIGRRAWVFIFKRKAHAKRFFDWLHAEGLADLP